MLLIKNLRQIKKNKKKKKQQKQSKLELQTLELKFYTHTEKQTLNWCENIIECQVKTKEKSHAD